MELPKKFQGLGNCFFMCKQYCCREPLWCWIEKIALLINTKVAWDNSYNNPTTAKCIMTVDGTNFRTWEKKHPTLPLNPAYCSHQYKHGALLYAIALSIFTNKCIYVSDAFPGGAHDMTII